MKRAFRPILEALSLFFAFFICSVLSHGEPYAIFKLAAWLSIAYLAGRYLRPLILFLFFAVAGSLESLLGIFQFIIHKSAGLSVLGEPVLSPLNPVLARMFVPGGRLLRAYGTFPHPNILAAFLALSLISLAYFHMRSGARMRIALVIPIFIVSAGLILTFSRTGWFAGLMGVFVPIFLSRKSRPREARNTAFVFIVCAFAAIAAFSFVVFPRIASISPSDYSVTVRSAGYVDSLGRIAASPFFGSGITMRMSLDPVHSVYLAIAEEVGLIGLMAFLFILCAALFRGFRDARLEYQAFFAMLCALILVGLTDHFLWTLRPGAAMLWVVIGMLSFSQRSRS